MARQYIERDGFAATGTCARWQIECPSNGKGSSYDILMNGADERRCVACPRKASTGSEWGKEVPTEIIFLDRGAQYVKATTSHIERQSHRIDKQTGFSLHTAGSRELYSYKSQKAIRSFGLAICSQRWCDAGNYHLASSSLNARKCDRDLPFACLVATPRHCVHRMRAECLGLINGVILMGGCAICVMNVKFLQYW